MLVGLDRVVKDPDLASDWGRFAVVSHGASVDLSGVSCARRLFEVFGKERLRAVFGPQHGYWQCEPYNMFETPDGELPINFQDSLPLYSLYGETREPTDRQLEGVDTLVVDLPDIGCRVYTYMTTLAACMRAAARLGKRVVVLDRPNPLGLSLGSEHIQSAFRVSGNLMDLSLRSFVGWFRIPLVHGLTLGELGHLFVEQENLKVHYDVVEVHGLSRQQSLIDLRDVSSRMASPNMPGHWTMSYFPVSVCLEGTNISEGRGTTSPFQSVGAPFISELALFESIQECYDRLGIGSRPLFRPHRFRPRFDKFPDSDCGGIFYLEQENTRFCHFESCIALLCGLACAARENLQWRELGYEYNIADNPLDLILGDRRWRPSLETLKLSSKPGDAVWRKLRDDLAWAATESAEFADFSRRFWLYE